MAEDQARDPLAKPFDFVLISDLDWTMVRRDGWYFILQASFMHAWGVRPVAHERRGQIA